MGKIYSKGLFAIMLLPVLVSIEATPKKYKLLQRFAFVYLHQKLFKGN